MPNLFRAKTKANSAIVENTRIFVLSLDKEFDETAVRDAEVYRAVFPNTKTITRTTVKELSDIIAGKCDVVHLLCHLTREGSVIDQDGAQMTGTDLISLACASDTKLLFIATGNPSDAYIKGFRAKGMAINLVMTLSRNGESFRKFLGSLLREFLDGKTMATAWAVASSPSRAMQPEDLPTCIFFAGKPNFTPIL